jgi:hypothetical protein
LQVEAHAAGIGREEHAARGVVVEIHEVLRAPPLALLAGEERRSDALARESCDRALTRRTNEPF